MLCPPFLWGLFFIAALSLGRRFFVATEELHGLPPMRLYPRSQLVQRLVPQYSHFPLQERV